MLSYIASNNFVGLLIVALLLAMEGAECFFRARDKEDARAEYVQGLDHLDEQQEKETAAEIKHLKDYGKFFLIMAAIPLASAFML